MQRKRKGWAFANPIVPPGHFAIVQPNGRIEVVDRYVVRAAHLIATRYPDHKLMVADSAGKLQSVDLHIDGPSC